jgi:hypothetical protein
MRPAASAEKMSAERNIVVLTGAGMSAESGVPTFRGVDGLWEGHRIEDGGFSPEGFARDPELVQRFYNLRRAALKYGGAQCGPSCAGASGARVAWKASCWSPKTWMICTSAPAVRSSSTCTGSCSKARCRMLRRGIVSGSEELSSGTSLHVPAARLGGYASAHRLVWGVPL